jgi:2-polyprenyl-3-methyl-5-hydroxy-6-metoxy-1,4-benzoquinol methylase
VICSEVIEHIREDSVFKELKRTIKPGGRLILGTPDYSRLSWRVIEFFYGILLRGGYKEEHIRHWDRRSLEKILTGLGFLITGNYYICGSELIISAEAPL